MRNNEWEVWLQSFIAAGHWRTANRNLNVRENFVLTCLLIKRHPTEKTILQYSPKSSVKVFSLASNCSISTKLELHILFVNRIIEKIMAPSRVCQATDTAWCEKRIVVFKTFRSYPRDLKFMMLPKIILGGCNCTSCQYLPAWPGLACFFL